MKYYLKTRTSLYAIGDDSNTRHEIMEAANEAAVGTLVLGEDIVIVCSENNGITTKEYARSRAVDNGISGYDAWELA